MNLKHRLLCRVRFSTFFCLFLSSSMLLAQVADDGYEALDINNIENLLEKNISFTNPEPDVSRSTLKAPPKLNYKEVEVVGRYDDLAIVQRNYMPKTERFSLTLGGALVPTDVYYRTMGLSTKLAYHFNEFWAAEGHMYLMDSTKRDEIRDIRDKQNLTVQNLISIRSYYGLNLFYSPIYGKTSILNSRIIPFEIYQTIGIGKVKNQNNKESDSFQIGLGELFSISRSSALRADLNWAFYQTSSILGEKESANSLFLSFNYTFFFGEPAYR